MSPTTISPLKSGTWGQRAAEQTVGVTNVPLEFLTLTSLTAFTVPSAPMTRYGLPWRPPRITTSASQLIGAELVGSERRPSYSPIPDEPGRKSVQRCHSPVMSSNFLTVDWT